MKFVEASEILDVRTGKFDANHAVEKGGYNFYTCALVPLRADTFSFDDEVLILPGNGANVGEVLHYKGKLEAYQRTYVLHNIKAHPRYLYFYFKKFWIRQITKYQVGSATNYIKMGDITSFKIPLPPLSTQKKIAAILDAADAYRQKTKALIDKYDELAQSLFLDMFGDPVTNPKGWEMKTVGEVAEKVTDGEHQNPQLVESGKHLIMAKNVLSDGVDFSNPKFVSDEDYFKFVRKCKPEIEDLLLVSRGATVGRCTTVKSKVGFCLMGSVILVKTNERLKGSYLQNLFSHRGVFQKLVTVSSSSAQQAIYITHLKKLSIPVPPIEVQNRFDQFLRDIFEQKIYLLKGMKKSEDLFNSLLQRAFKGELV